MVDAKEKLGIIAHRAASIKADKTKRHCPNEHDLSKSRENSALMQPCQYEAIIAERTGRDGF